MSKLDPKPVKQGLNYSWEDLNKFLQSHFGTYGSDHAYIDVRNYSMSKEEIITELEQKGYEVSENSEHKLKIK